MSPESGIILAINDFTVSDPGKHFALVTFGLGAIALIVALSISSGNKKAKKLPPGPKGWPLLGAISYRRIIGMKHTLLLCKNSTEKLIYPIEQDNIIENLLEILYSNNIPSAAYVQCGEHSIENFNHHNFR